MIGEKVSSLKTILESQQGIHLTAYIQNTKELDKIKTQLQLILYKAKEELKEILEEQELNNFLKPINNLLVDSRIFINTKGNIGIFRSNTYFSLFIIPVSIKNSIHIASSFHVKPILKWLQTDEDFYLLGVDDKGAHLYFGNQKSIKKIAHFEDIEHADFYHWLYEILQSKNSFQKHKLFFAGDEKIIIPIIKKLNYSKKIKTPAALIFKDFLVYEICQKIRIELKKYSQNKLNKAILEFNFFDRTKLAQNNIHKIAKAAIEKKIKKLIIAENINVFGKIDALSGEVTIHNSDLNHEDDDILDDLAQIVLRNGGEVIMASKSEIPKGKPVLALIDEDNIKSAQYDTKFISPR